ncbi:MAG: hypothetical protein LBS91_06845 [Clostridiales Family XIII bacterium]|jgi:hypothetical protein|nr:hypothetical protein [Clostridiales Family XIII bacterium]
MGVGEAFLVSGQIYVLGFAIALGMAALIKLINHIISRSDAKEAAKAAAAGGEGGAK